MRMVLIIGDFEGDEFLFAHKNDCEWRRHTLTAGGEVCVSDKYTPTAASCYCAGFQTKFYSAI